MSGLSTIAATLLGGLSLTLAPIPPEPKPDPYGRGYLGVWFEGSSLSINRVEPNMPGAKAGLRTGDLILRVNSLHAQSTDQVIAHVCSFRPGAVIEMEVQRGSERKVFKIKLGTRPPDNEMQTPLPQPISPSNRP
jgi:S1-C subfamily serine protease